MEKKRHPKFVVPNFGLKTRKRVSARWRMPRGIDSKKRVKKKESGASPSIGYKNRPELRYARSDGVFETLIHNEGELLSAAKTKKDTIIRFAHSLSVRKRIALQAIADKHGLKVANKVRKV